MYNFDPKVSHPDDVGSINRIHNAQITEDSRLEFARVATDTGSGKPSQVNVPGWIMALIGAPGPQHRSPQEMSYWMLEPEGTMLVAPGNNPDADGQITARLGAGDSYQMSFHNAFKDNGHTLQRHVVVDVNLRNPSEGLHVRNAEAGDRSLRESEGSLSAREVLRYVHAAGALDGL